MTQINSVSMGDIPVYENAKTNTDEKVQVDLTQKPDSFEKKSKAKKGATIGAGVLGGYSALCCFGNRKFLSQLYKSNGRGKGALAAGIALNVAAFAGAGALLGAGIGKIVDVCTNKGNKE